MAPNRTTLPTTQIPIRPTAAIVSIRENPFWRVRECARTLNLATRLLMAAVKKLDPAGSSADGGGPRRLVLFHSGSILIPFGIFRAGSIDQPGRVTRVW